MAHHKQPLQAPGGCLADDAEEWGLAVSRVPSLSYMVEGSILGKMEGGRPDPPKSHACHDKTVLFPYGNNLSNR